MAAVFVTSLTSPRLSPVMGYVRAFAEAAMVERHVAD